MECWVYRVILNASVLKHGVADSSIHVFSPQLRESSNVDFAACFGRSLSENNYLFRSEGLCPIRATLADNNGYLSILRVETYRAKTCLSKYGWGLFVAQISLIWMLGWRQYWQIA